MTGAALGVKAGNATVGANGATAKEVGESTIEFAGTPAVGDIYTLKVHGEEIKLKVAAESGSAFTYQFSATNFKHATAGGTAVGATGDLGSITVGGASGQTTTDIAKAMKAAIDAVGAGTLMHSSGTSDEIVGDVTGTVNADGTLTLNNPINLTVTTATDQDPNNAVHAVDRSVANQETHTFDVEDSHFVNDLNISINNVVIDLDLKSANAEYADSGAGMKEAFDNKITELQAAGKLAGLTFVTSLGDFGAGTETTGDFKIVVSRTDTTAVSDVSASAGLSTNAVLISSQSDASAAIATIDAAIVKVNAQRANLGAVSNRLDSTVNNLTSISSNLAAGKGRIEDADFAAETTSLAKSQILQQASTAMLAQANASKQNVLSLLQG
jgi:flagellin-like hook-associated protein FlgL